MASLRIPSLKRYLIWLLQQINAVKDVSVWSFERNLSDLEVMTVLLEDRRYFNHPGIDPQSIVRALTAYFSGNRNGGASTIEMQLIRTISKNRDVTLARKLNEAILGLLLGFHMSKGSILRTYMNCAYYGTGLTGVNEACQKAFSKSVDQINFDEAAILAAMLVHPMPRVPSVSWYARIRRRAEYGKLLYSRYEKRFQNLGIAD